MAKAVYTVDIDPWVEENIVPDLPDNTDFFTRIDDVPPVECAFVDGSHKFKNVMKDIEDVKKRVPQGGLIVYHDLNINEVWNALKASSVHFVPVNTYCGMGISWNE